MSGARKVFLRVALAAAVGLGGLFAGARMQGLGVKDVCAIVKNVVQARMERRTVEDRVAEILAKKPGLKAVAESAKGPLRILVFKQERMLEMYAPGWTEPRKYPMTAFSGTLGPKLKEGDGQIPEGVYGLAYLNPNSSYHLSMKVSYPNAEDRAQAAKDGRTNLGGDIMIHGSNATVGCVPVGDEAIEELFYLVQAAGLRNVSVVIAPYDMRAGRKSELEARALHWYPALCARIAESLSATR